MLARWPALIALLIGLPSLAVDSRPADSWVTNAVYPLRISEAQVHRGRFESLRAEPIDTRHLQIVWHPVHLETNAGVALLASADAPGHWPARDWRTYPMTLSDQDWVAQSPVYDLNVPIVYFVRVTDSAGTNYSPMRICRPQLLGLSASRPFRPFLEGFEHGTEGWTLTGKSGSSLSVDPIAHSGHYSLKVSLSAGQKSVAIGTTRIRGWQFVSHDATGVLLWMRTKGGSGHVGFTLYDNAFTTNQVTSESSIVATVTNGWQKFSLPLSSFPKLSPGGVDWFAIEFKGNGSLEFLIDDLQLTGPWKPEPE